MDKYVKILLLSALLFCIFSCDDKNRKAAFSKNRVSELIEKAKGESSASVSLKYLDSAYAQLLESPNDTTTRYHLRSLTATYYNKEFYDKAIKSSRQLYNLSLEAKDSSAIARSLYIAADALYAKQNKDSAFYLYTQSEKIYKTINDVGRLGEVVLYKAYIYYDIGEYELCEDQAFRALTLLQNQKKDQDVYYCYNLIALALDGQNNNDEALKYYQNTLNQLEVLRGKAFSDEYADSYKASVYNNMGGVYVKKGEHKKAISIYNEALSYNGLQELNPTLYSKLLNNLAYAKFKWGDMKNLPDLFNQAFEIRKKNNDNSGMIASHLNLGEYYASQKDTATALVHLKTAYNDATKIKSHFEVLSALKLLSEIDKENSSYYSTQYIKISKQLEDVAKKVRDRFARIEYETDRLEYEKEALIKKNSFIIAISAVVLLFIAAIFMIYYLNSRNKKLLLIQQQQKANEEIYQLMFEQQAKVEAARREEKNRIAMELHDGILNNIYAVRLNLEFINKKADEESIQKRKEYIKELQKVETEIRGVSHDLSRNAIFQGDKSFNTLLEFMINSQKNTFETRFDLKIEPGINFEAMDNVAKVNVYRIIQEALQNINKYSQAKNAYITIKKEGDNIAVKVEDDGVGFDPEKARGGIGIKNLKKRAALLNGEFTINSAPGKGSAIEVVFKPSA